MRFLLALVLTGALAVVGCGDDEETNGTGGTGATGGTGGTGGGTGGAGGGTGGAGGGMTAAPVIENIAWAPVGSCAQATPSDYTVTVTASDADNDVMELTYSGSVVACTPGITAAESTVGCPNNAPYAGTVTVSDPDSNEAVGSFTIGVCETADCQGTPGTPCSL